MRPRGAAQRGPVRRAARSWPAAARAAAAAACGTTRDLTGGWPCLACARPNARRSELRRAERRTQSRRTDPADAGHHLSNRRKSQGKAPAPPPPQPKAPPSATPPRRVRARRAAAPPARPARSAADAPRLRPHRLLNETLVDLICGAVAEATQLAALYPLDTLKVRCQLSRRRPLAELRALLAGGGPAGVRALYAGCAPAAVGAALFGGAYMLAYQAFYRRNVRLLTGRAAAAAAAEEEPEAPPLALLGLAAGGAAMLANCCTALVEVPLDTARQRLQAGVARGSMARIIAASARGGPRLLYAGFVPFLLRTIPLDALQFTVYEGLQSARERADAREAREAAGSSSSSSSGGGGDDTLGEAAMDMVLGGIAGGVSAFLTMPLDCIKTHINCAAGAAQCGVLPVTRAIWAASGPRGFFAGTSSRLLERVPSCAVYWLAAEATRRVLAPEAAAQPAALA